MEKMTVPAALRREIKAEKVLAERAWLLSQLQN